MPVNLLPVYAVAAVLWLAAIFYLTKWKPAAAVIFTALSFVAAVIYLRYTDVRKDYSEAMSFKITRIGDVRFVEFTDVRGDKYSTTEPKIASHLEEKHEKQSDVVLSAWYDFGRLRSYNLKSVDGLKAQ